MVTFINGELPSARSSSLSVRRPLLTMAEQVALQRAPRRAATHDARGPALGAAEGVGGYAAENGIRADQVRRAYVGKVGRLEGSATAERAALKQSMRAVTPAPQREWLNYERPDLGAKVGSIGGAARTNPAATARALQFARLGRASLLGSALLGGVEIATAEDKPRAASSVAGGMGGGVAGGIAGAELGALVGSIVPGPGTAIGAIAGGVLGSLGGGALGHEAGGRIHDRLREHR